MNGFEEWFEQEFPEEMSTPTLKLLYKEIAKKGWDAAMRQRGDAPVQGKEDESRYIPNFGDITSADYDKYLAGKRLFHRS